MPPVNLLKQLQSKRVLEPLKTSPTQQIFLCDLKFLATDSNTETIMWNLHIGNGFGMRFGNSAPLFSLPPPSAFSLHLHLHLSVTLKNPFKIWLSYTSESYYWPRSVNPFDISSQQTLTCSSWRASEVEDNKYDGNKANLGDLGHLIITLVQQLVSWLEGLSVKLWIFSTLRCLVV